MTHHAPDRSHGGADVEGIGRWFAPARLRVTAGDLELRLPTDAEIAELIAVVDEQGVHPPGEQPMASTWTEDPPAERAMRMYQWHWHTRASFQPEDWRWLPGVFVEGRIVGVQDLFATDFATFRTAETASWLAQDMQGRGIGTRMRAMVLHLLFEGLGGRFATTSARHDNARSTGVTRRMGYEPNGEFELAVGGRPGRTLAWRMSADRWRATRPDRAAGLDVEVHGLDADVRAAFGVSQS